MNISHVKDDILASIVVFFVAIPLCLGIAMASGAPLFSGIITGVIGGIIVGALSSSPLSVSGPAAGMITIVLACMQQIGSFEGFLLALCFAGILQILCGIARGGFIANFVPANVIQGLLVAIGLLIIVKQLPLAFGYFAEPGSLQNSLREAQDTLSLMPLYDVYQHIHPGATLMTIISLMILISWGHLRFKAAKFIPAAVIVVVLGVVINKLFAAFVPALELIDAHLVNIPVNENWQHFFSQFQHPDFSLLNNSKIYFSALMIAVVATLETLLNFEATEKIDSKRRHVSPNRELVAQGVGNLISGLLGGLPITSVIVRSSVNANAGAQSKLSTIIHGFLLLIAISFAAEWLNYIPLAALAAILIHTGYKLAKPTVFRQAYQEGPKYFIPFIVTVVAIVFTNLLLGILIGLAISVSFILFRSSKNCFTKIDEMHPAGDVIRLMFPQQVTFLSKSAMIEELNTLPENSKVILDAKFTDYIDNEILVVLKDFSTSQAKIKNILLNFEGFKDDYRLDNQSSFIYVTTYAVQASLTPELILTVLREGNNRFVNNMPIHKNYKQQITATSQSQHPIAVVLSCIDSRVPVELVFDLSVGDIFVVRIAGNIANKDILGCLEFACQVAGAKLILVLGHKECGAIKAACDDFHLGHVTDLINKIKPAITLEKNTISNRNSKNSEFVLNVTRTNIKLTEDYIYQKSEVIRKLIDSKQVGIIGGLYDVTTGIVEFEKMNDFVTQLDKTNISTS